MVSRKLAQVLTVLIAVVKTSMFEVKWLHFCSRTMEPISIDNNRWEGIVAFILFRRMHEQTLVILNWLICCQTKLSLALLAMLLVIIVPFQLQYKDTTLLE